MRGLDGFFVEHDCGWSELCSRRQMLASKRRELTVSRTGLLVKTPKIPGGMGAAKVLIGQVYPSSAR